MPKLLTGAEIVFKALEDQNVEYIFGYPGGAVLPIYDELKNHKTIKHILARHEQGAAWKLSGGMESKPDVKSLLNQVHHPHREDHVDRGLGILNPEVPHALDHLTALPKAGRRGDPQRSRGLRIRLQDRLLRVLQLEERRPQAPQESSSFSPTLPAIR